MRPTKIRHLCEVLQNSRSLLYLGVRLVVPVESGKMRREPIRQLTQRIAASEDTDINKRALVRLRAYAH